MRARVAVLSQALMIFVAIISDQLISLAYNGLGAEVLAAATRVHLGVVLLGRVVDAGSLDSLAEAVLICLTLRVALQNVIASTIHAAP